MSDSFTCHIPSFQKNAIIIDVEVLFEMPALENAKYASIKIKALIDTGANGTCISHRLSSACHLPPVSAMKIFSAQGASIVPVYKMSIKLPTGTEFKNVLATEVAGSENFDAIIGMDILSQGDFALTSDKNGLVFSLRFPSKNEPIDFTK